MKPRQQLTIADAVTAYRRNLKATVEDLARRGDPLTSIEAELLAELADARLAPLEAALRGDVNRTLRGRLRFVLRARIGTLRHHDPVPLAVPLSYFRAQPPDPPPTISIVTPSFQQGRFLDRTLYSVAAQNYPALEYIVQDGGSIDESVEVLKRFDSVVTSWRSEPDGGQADAINRGFRRTTGEIMAWLNSDDLFLPGALAFVAKFFARHPDVDVLYGNRIMIDEHDRAVGTWILPSHDDRALTLADYVPQETLFWRRSAWDAAGGGVDPTFEYAVDWDLLLRFRGAGARIAHVPRYLGAFRVHDEQKTTAADVRGALECDLIRERLHGRAVPIDEVLSALRPYLARHVFAHLGRRVLERVPTPWAIVQTIPTEPWLRRPTPLLERLGEETRPSEPEVVDDGIAPLPLPPQEGRSRSSASVSGSTFAMPG